MNVNYFNDNNKMLKNNFHYDLFCFMGGIYRNSNLQAPSLEREREFLAEAVSF